MIGNDPKYQAIINAYKAGQLATTTPQYNPIYDIRSEQIAAGEIPAGSQFPKPQLVTTPTEEDKTEDTFDPCPPGYQLIDGVCQPDTMFQQSGGDGGGQDIPSPYIGNIYTPMANDPINTELRRFAAQEDYQPTFMDSLGELGRKFMQFSPIVGVLNALGLGPSYTETVKPRFQGGGFNPFANPRTYTVDTTGMGTGFNPFTNQMLGTVYPGSITMEPLAALDMTNPLIRSGASQSAVESVTKAMTDQAVQAAAQQAFKDAQTEATKKEGSKQKDRMITAAVGKSYTGGPTVRGKSGMLGGGV